MQLSTRTKELGPGRGGRRPGSDRSVRPMTGDGGAQKAGL